MLKEYGDAGHEPDRPPNSQPSTQTPDNLPQSQTDGNNGNSTQQKRNRNRKRPAEAKDQLSQQSTAKPVQKQMWVAKTFAGQQQATEPTDLSSVNPQPTHDVAPGQKQRPPKQKREKASQKEANLNAQADAQKTNDPFQQYLNVNAGAFDPAKNLLQEEKKTMQPPSEINQMLFQASSRGGGDIYQPRRGRGRDQMNQLDRPDQVHVKRPEQQKDPKNYQPVSQNESQSTDQRPLTGNRGGARQGRGRGGYHQSDAQNENSMQQNVSQTNDQRPLTENRGGPRQGRGRGGYHQSENQSSQQIQAHNGAPVDHQKQQDVNPTYQNTTNQPSSQANPPRRQKGKKEFFEERKNDASKIDRQNEELLNQDKVRHHKEKVQNTDQALQVRGKRGAQFKSIKNLGSAANYTEDEQKYAAPEKVSYYQKGNQKDSRDQAKIKYNHKDFLSQFANLTEQCIFYVQSLATGSQECIICQNQIYQRSALWNCQQCYTPFHLGCIKRWIQKLNKPLAENIRDQEQEERKGHEHAQNQDYSDEEDDNSGPLTEAQEQAKKLLAFYSWTCPNCNYSYAENKMPTYYCYCQRFSEPAYDALILPHSCGEYCEKKKNKDCTHDACDVLCHPGACPPCNINVPVECFCEKETKRVPCHVSKRTKFSCEQLCLKNLNCKKHQCQRACHEGPCSPCDELKIETCFCGNNTIENICGTPQHSCREICNKQLDCGLHDCQKVCHKGKCEACPYDPSRVKYCPSGHNTIEKLIGGQRKSCTEDIPTCNALCERFLPCGKHQCVKKCHNEDCMRCDQPTVKKCPCGKDQRKLLCYQVNYPQDKKERMMSKQEIQQIDGFRCQKICNKQKSCNKHTCKEICCAIDKSRGRLGDPEGIHRCTIVCDKKLSCGKHNCTDLCHLGFCKPCQWVNIKPVYCPCNIAKLDPPIKCGQPIPSCGGPCLQKLACGHPCSMQCHSGPCPPCLELVVRLCNCGKEIKNGVFCKEGSHSCGQSCETDLECGHRCQKVCHIPGQCIVSREDLLKNGCGMRCSKERIECSHRCQANCHPGTDCPKTPCEAEIRLFCNCGFRWVQVICKSVSERPPIECDSRCWKKQRDEKIANAFGSAQDFRQNKDTIKFEYYPEESIQFAQENMAWAKKIESQLTYCVLNKSSKSYASLSAPKRQFLGLLVYEHFLLDMCSYGQSGQKRTTDVFWREGCKIPTIMCSEIADLINKGIEEVRHESDKTTIFEASIYICNVGSGYSIDTLKKFLGNFKNEMYTEKGKSIGQFAIHFYQKQRARDALSFIQNTPNQFSNCQLVEHRREIGTLPQPGMEEEKSQKRGKRMIEEDDGFTKVTR